jgi:Holliday junction resolvase RusA-like endonuclease
MTGITLNLPVPPSVNRTRRVDWRGQAAAARWHTKADAAVLFQKRGELPRFNEPVQILIAVTASYGGDLSNLIKQAEDYLVRLNIIPDDSPKYVQRITIEIGEAPEGIRVTVQSI